VSEHIPDNGRGSTPEEIAEINYVKSPEYINSGQAREEFEKMYDAAIRANLSEEEFQKLIDECNE
jgi:hypothetical protein